MLRLAMETRKVMLVDIALDLVQKLIAHHHLAGPVHAITHKRDVGSVARPSRRKSHDDDDGAVDLAAAGDAPMPPQVRTLLSCAHLATRAPPHGHVASHASELRKLPGLQVEHVIP